MQKGSYIMVEGKLVNRDYLDANGQKKYITEVRAFNILLLDKRANNNDNDQQESTESNTDDSDLPF